MDGADKIIALINENIDVLRHDISMTKIELQECKDKWEAGERDRVIILSENLSFRAENARLREKLNKIHNLLWHCIGLTKQDNKWIQEAFKEAGDEHDQ